MLGVVNEEIRKNKKILLLDDSVEYTRTIRNILEKEHYNVESKNDPILMLEEYQAGEFDLLIIDYAMGSMNGIQLLKMIKKLDSQVKTILFTGIDDPEVELAALKNYANFFVRKGVPKEILLEYVSRVLNEKVIEEKTDVLISEKEGIVVNTEEYRVYRDNKEVPLKNMEYNLLSYFLSNKGKVLRREQILDDVWGHKAEIIDQRTVDTHVKQLRKVLRIKCIQSVRLVGYRWNE